MYEKLTLATSHTFENDCMHTFKGKKLIYWTFQWYHTLYSLFEPGISVSKNVLLSQYYRVFNFKIPRWWKRVLFLSRDQPVVVDQLDIGIEFHC